MERDPEMTYDRLSNKNVKTAIINTPHSRASTEKQEHNMERQIKDSNWTSRDMNGSI